MNITLSKERVNENRLGAKENLWGPLSRTVLPLLAFKKIFR